jgi:hypothetical protein
MKTLLISLLALTVTLSANSQLYLTQAFDGADTTADYSLNIELDTNIAVNSWQIGPPQKTHFNSPASPPNVIVTDTINHYPDNDSSSFIFKVNTDPGNWGGWGILALQWKQKLDYDSVSMDGGVVEYSIDQGATWESPFLSPYVYNFYGFNDPENVVDIPQNDYLGAFGNRDTVWRDIWLCFDLSWATISSDSIFLRFTNYSDSITQQSDGWMIDNMIAHLTSVHTVNEVPSDTYMTIQPNPTSDRIEIRTKKLNEFHIIEKMSLVDQTGKSVQQWEMVPTKFGIDIGHHPAGIYFLNVQTNKQSETFRVILE